MKRFFYIIASLLLAGCSGSDISIIDQKETRVVVDSFVQAEPIDKLDVLISLDTSGSMGDNYEDVANGMELLRYDIEGLTLDYRFGYITMDPTNIGYVGPYDATSSSIDMLLAPNLLPSAGLEEGFAATYVFLNSEEGLSFRRPEADFLLFLISDEDEQSQITPEIFYEWLHDEMYAVQHDVVAIANPNNGQGGWGHDVGFEYIDLAALYEKDIIDIQKEDWSVWLSDSSYLINTLDYVKLSENEPIVESIVVYIDNQIIYDWQYDELSNVVNLSSVPNYGALVEVGYKIYV